MIAMVLDLCRFSSDGRAARREKRKRALWNMDMDMDMQNGRWRSLGKQMRRSVQVRLYHSSNVQRAKTAIR